MNVVCPACSKRHRVSDQMAGKRAKCSCGEVIAIPATPVSHPAADGWSKEAAVAPAAGPLSGAVPTSTSGLGAQTEAGTVLFQCDYGLVRRSMRWLLGANFIIALVLIPVGILRNDGWALNNVPLPPWGATLICEFTGIGLLLMIAYMVAGYFLNGRHHQRVAVTAAGVILPKNKLSTQELFIPWSEVRVKHRGGPVEQLQFKRGVMKTSQITSIQFPTDEDFEAFFDYLREHEKV